MAITKQQQADRAKGLGSSDMAAVLGLDPHRSGMDVWLEKTGRVPPFEGNKHTDRGDRLEAVVLDWMSDEIGEKIVKPTSTYVVRGNEWLRVNVDGQVGKSARGHIPCEAKSTLIQTGWGRPGTDEVPDKVVIQCSCHMLATETERCYAGRIGMNLDFSLYELYLDNDVAKAILERGHEFYHKYVVEDIRPPEHEYGAPSLDLLSRMTYESGTSSPVPEHVAARYRDARAAAKVAETEADAAKADLLMHLNGHQVGECAGWKIRYTTVNVTRLDQKALEAAEPDLVAKYRVASSYQRLDCRES